ncbi:MAG TPA: CAP domain-containing protein [Solirubrobacteraceae bacterium]|nr:CAP domain-containing protein [Solirubrobacteraceae bacterium]
MGHSSCRSGTHHHRHHTAGHHRHHTAGHRSNHTTHRAAAHTPSHPALSHVAEGPGANGTVTVASPSDGPCQGAGLIPGEEDLDDVRAATLCLVNRERAAHGEGPLATNSDLQHAAQDHSESMASGAYFEHSGPGGTFLQRIMASGYLPGPNALYSVGENIAYGTLQDATPASIVAAWMRSPGHRANILNSSFREIGIGIAPHLPASLGGGEVGAMYTEDFGVVV